MQKRKRIMARSIALGHCVCDPQKPCPCPLFKEMNVCECAGERLPRHEGPVRLTEHVRSAGCASKIGKKDLLSVLAGLPEIDDPRVLVGRSAGDDAAVLDRGDGAVGILTVDVFAPSVDDPYTFGQIAAANSVSDVYAMGATPEAALSVVGYPIRLLPEEPLKAMLRGGIDKLAEAGISVVGGHSINDAEIKFGFAVVGRARKEDVVTNRGARPGDAVVLTKPLGVGLVAFAAQIGRAGAEAVERIAASMSALNKTAGLALNEYDAHAATDVTGFSLLGHMAEVVRNSNVEVTVDFDALPLFPEVQDLACQEVLPGAVERNREAVATELLDFTGLTEAQRSVCFCPETSGGLLVFLPPEQAERYLAMLHADGVDAARIIGRVTGEREDGLIRLTTKGAADWSTRRPTPVAMTVASPSASSSSCCCGEPPKTDESCCATPPAETACCANPPEAEESTPAPAAQRESFLVPLPDDSAAAFEQYMGAVNRPGALDAKQKKLIALALSVATKCEPCVKVHTKGLREAGASEAEIAEAAALGVSFGGASVAMFYNTLAKEG